jgi:hypothetical protein
MKDLADFAKRGNGPQNELERTVEWLVERMRMVPSTFVGGADSERPPIYITEGFNSFVNFGLTGIEKTVTVLDGSTLPAGVGGSPGDTIAMSPFPPPAGLSAIAGIGVGRLYGTGDYSFLLLDGHSLWQDDVVYRQPVETDQEVTLIRTSGGVNYSYACRVIFAAF